MRGRGRARFPRPLHTHCCIAPALEFSSRGPWSKQNPCPPVEHGQRQSFWRLLDLGSGLAFHSLFYYVTPAADVRGWGCIFKPKVICPVA